MSDIKPGQLWRMIPDRRDNFRFSGDEFILIIKESRWRWGQSWTVLKAQSGKKIELHDTVIREFYRLFSEASRDST